MRAPPPHKTAVALPECGNHLPAILLSSVGQEIRTAVNGFAPETLRNLPAAKTRAETPILWPRVPSSIAPRRQARHLPGSTFRLPARSNPDIPEIPASCASRSLVPNPSRTAPIDLRTCVHAFRCAAPLPAILSARPKSLAPCGASAFCAALSEIPAKFPELQGTDQKPLLILEPAA